MPQAVTGAYHAFISNIDRAEALVRIFERGRTRGRPTREDTQLPRSSLVFSIAALDAYLHDLVLEIVSEQVPQSDDLDVALKKMNAANIVQTMARAANHDDARDHFRRKLDEHFDDSSFMDVGGLMRALRLVGCSMDADEIGRRTGRTNATSELARFTDQRHRIIHRAENVRVYKVTAQECASLVRSIAETADRAVVAKWNL